MSHIIIDRRKSDKKSSVNRKKFITRAKEVIRESVKDMIKNSNIEDLASGNTKKIKIPARNLDEPHFVHTSGGINDIVVPGNDKYVVDDKIKRHEQGGGKGGSKGAEDGEGEDDFVFHLTKEEFLDIFFENCELPDMMQKSIAVMVEEEINRAGFTNSGSPSALNVVRSFRQAKSRRVGMRAARRKVVTDLEEQIATCQQQLDECDGVGIDKITEELLTKKLLVLREELAIAIERMKRVPFIDPVDLRYNNWDVFPIPTTQAVMFCVMDVSGSMDEQKKQLAKIFFLMLYLFLQRDYERIVVRYIRYHSEAKVVEEQEFYYGVESGGTVTSTGLKAVKSLIENEYPTSIWNAYIAHASDGDNFTYDNNRVNELLADLLPIIQYYAYVQIEPNTSKIDPESLYGLFEEAQDQYANVGIGHVTDETEIYPVFTKLFTRNKKSA